MKKTKTVESEIAGLPPRVLANNVHAVSMTIVKSLSSIYSLSSFSGIIFVDFFL